MKIDTGGILQPRPTLEFRVLVLGEEPDLSCIGDTDLKLAVSPKGELLLGISRSYQIEVGVGVEALSVGVGSGVQLDVRP